MSTITMHATTTVTPEQYTAALTDSGHTYRYTRNADGTTEINYVVVREGKNAKGRFLGIVLGSVGKSRLVKAFHNSVTAVEARDDPANASQP